MLKSEDVLAFWLDEVGPKGWYMGGEELDARIRDFALPTWEAAMAGQLGLWLTHPSGVLAYLILMDQFPRNMFRGEGKAFASDAKALAAAKCAIDRKWDMKIDEPARQFFYLPLMHSECLSDQERCVRLMKERMPESGDDNLLHAKAHRYVIRRFGRFPYRNTALDREEMPLEAEFLKGGGYKLAVEALSA
ncbi:MULTISPECIES: DUF924 family protein [Halocynthiibacter]|uniref:DUF924 domain-containing protein n=1 Tax=Halocynthiibacter halioticoli TaxID=2986804 RepID=A0AAE3IY36_9RHOB|nr:MULTISPECIES: DUF924 family protein [Halocynthiibacter]MCV6824139.1 DUF924 domain-containing protein [Halocynthiibacter halioticoli]MCW4057140.1 DUF924 domain-containing protein [Halocynthiibacter sp. SDUM655004]MDE0589830.1 DUF924 domain-containing protein [Halocynthiibacter sp. C4]